MKNIKSSFITKRIILYIDEKRKLKLLKYCKNIRNKVGIDLLNYKLLSERYFIYETKEKGKEYDSYNDRLIYEGEYLNGERNGKGKEYNKVGKLIFVGEFKKGKRWDGYGYNPSCKYSYDYQLKEGKGYVREYHYYDVHKKYEGEYLNGERNRKGKDYKCDNGDYYYDKKQNSDDVIFEGEYLCGKKLKGKEYINGKLEYEGEYLYGRKYNGKGYDKKGNIIYEIKNVNGTMKEYNNKPKLIFEGKYLNCQRNGTEKEYYEGKFIFKGEYLNGRRWNGKGKEVDNILVN